MYLLSRPRALAEARGRAPELEQIGHTEASGLADIRLATHRLSSCGHYSGTSILADKPSTELHT